MNDRRVTFLEQDRVAPGLSYEHWPHVNVPTPWIEKIEFLTDSRTLILTVRESDGRSREYVATLHRDSTGGIDVKGAL